MTLSRKALCALYALIGAAAFAGTWGNILGVVRELGFWAGTVRFWQDTLVEPGRRRLRDDCPVHANLGSSDRLVISREGEVLIQGTHV